MYAPALCTVTALRCDAVNPPLLGISKVVSEAALRALVKIDETAGMQWLQKHLDHCAQPLLDGGVGSRCRCHDQAALRSSGAVLGYNPRKPGGHRIAITPVCYRICEWCCALRCIPAINTIPNTPPQTCGRCWRNSGASAGPACCAVMPNGATKG